MSCACTVDANNVSCVGTQKNTPGLWIQELAVNFGLIIAPKMHQPLPISPITKII